MPPVAPSTRRHELDALRVLLFGGLIAYHLGLLYAAWSPSYLKSAHAQPWVEVLLLTTHPWRMCLLFLISGVATRFAVEKLGVGRLMVSRSLQFAPPLLLGIAVLAPLQAYLFILESAGYPKGIGPFFLELFSNRHTIVAGGLRFELSAYGHMWFVLYLWAYVGVLALSLWAAPRWGSVVQARLEQVLKGPGLLLWPLVALVALRLTLFPPLGVTLRFVDDWYNHAVSLGMFLFGFAIARSETIWDRLAALRWPALAMAATAWAGYVALWSFQGVPELLERSNPLMQMLYPVERWGAIVAVLGFARRWLRRDSRVVGYLNGGMFTYYVVHQPAMLMLLHQIKPLGLHGALEAALVLAGTVASCALVYELARGLGWFGLLVGAPAPGRGGRRPFRWFLRGPDALNAAH